MVRVTVGAKAKNYDFNVSDVDLKAFEGSDSSFSISQDDVKISENKSNYVILEGDFKLQPLLSGNYEKGIRQLDAITVVENGKIAYTASGLDMTGKDAASGKLFEQFLSGENYSIKGNVYANELTGGDKKDVILGLGGNDKLNGMGGNDTLSGSVGNDHLVGGLGKDVLTGGLAADIFVFVAGDGSDMISDFKANGRGRDHIDLTGHSQVSSFDDLVISHTRTSVMIEVGDDLIVLRNVSESRIDAADFLF